MPEHAHQDSEPLPAPIAPQTWDSERVARGKFIASGVSGFVELTATGTIVKTPNTGPEYEECRHELFLEAEIYRILGPHPRLIRVLDWDAQREVLTMEYMRRGTLKEFLASLPPHESTGSNYDDQISREQRLRWAVQCAEGLELLHSHGVWHCDFKPKNILLDDEGGIRIVDFGGSSLHHSTPSAHPGSRFAPPSKAFEWGLRQDLFSLGSMIYTIMTGAEPYADRGSDEVVELFERQYFPDTTHLLGGEIMRDCWLARVTSAGEVRMVLETLMASSSASADASGVMCTGGVTSSCRAHKSPVLVAGAR